MSDELKEVELFVLLALARLGEEAYGITVRNDIKERTGRAPSLATTYGMLDRLETRRLAVSRLSEPLRERGGRARKMYRITPRGVAALESARAALARAWGGLEAHPKLGVQ